MGKIYFDLDEYQKILRDFYHELDGATGADLKATLKKMYLFVLKNYEDGIIGPKKLAYDITGTMQFAISGIKELESITDLASELELPDEHIKGDPDQKLRELIEQIKKL